MINQVVEQNIYIEFRDFLYMDKHIFVLNIRYYKDSWNVSKAKKTFLWKYSWNKLFISLPEEKIRNGYYLLEENCVVITYKLTNAEKWCRLL